MMPTSPGKREAKKSQNSAEAGLGSTFAGHESNLNMDNMITNLSHRPKLVAKAPSFENNEDEEMAQE